MRNAVAIFLACGFAAPGVFADEPASIKVVKTWNELQSAVPIDLGAGVKVRLGLEAVKVPRWSGTLLYCLTEGYTPARSGDDSTLGPVLATYQFGEEERIKVQGQWRRAKEDWPQCTPAEPDSASPRANIIPCGGTTGCKGKFMKKV